MFHHLCLCVGLISISLCSASDRKNAQSSDFVQTGTETRTESEISYFSESDMDIDHSFKEQYKDHVGLKNSASDEEEDRFEKEKAQFSNEDVKSVEEKSSIEGSESIEKQYTSHSTDSDSVKNSEKPDNLIEGVNQDSVRHESSIGDGNKDSVQCDENLSQVDREQSKTANEAGERDACDLNKQRESLVKESVNNNDGESSDPVNVDKSSSLTDSVKSDIHEQVKLEAHLFHPQTPEAGKTPGPDGQESSDPPRQRRFYPLLYTFRTLFSSFLAELSNEASETTMSATSINSTDKSGNLTASEVLEKDNNSTENGTDSSKKTRFHCSPKNISSNTTGEVKIVNSTELLEILNFSKNQKASTCVLVLFYAPWCHFCARTAPYYNALARAYPQLDILAVDTSHFSYLNARFGTVAVPNVMLFHSRSAVRFNHTSRALDTFIEFVVNNTGLEPAGVVSLEPTDFLGPLPNTVVKGHDWLLWLAWGFVLTCSAVGFVRSRYGQGVITRLNVLWQEHQHIE